MIVYLPEEWVSTIRSGSYYAEWEGELISESCMMILMLHYEDTYVLCYGRMQYPEPCYDIEYGGPSLEAYIRSLRGCLDRCSTDPLV